MSASKKAVAKKTSKEISTDVAANMFEEDAGQGFEGMDESSFAIPFLQILQKGSPQVEEENAKYMEGAKPGMILNTVTDQLFDGKVGINVIPVTYLRRFVEFVLRSEGGGFVAEHIEALPTTRDENNRDILESGNELVDSRNHYVMLMNDDELEPCVISMSRTNVKTSKKWNTLARNLKRKTEAGKIYNPPLFSSVYSLTTAFQTKDQYTWYSWNVARMEDVESTEQYQTSKMFRQQVMDGLAKAAYDTVSPESENTDDVKEGEVVQEY